MTRIDAIITELRVAVFSWKIGFFADRAEGEKEKFGSDGQVLISRVVPLF